MSLIIFGWITAALTATRALPQLTRVLRTRTSHGGVSLEAAAVNVVGYVPWALYATDRALWPLAAASCAAIAVYVVLAWHLVTFGAPVRVLVRPAGYAAAIGAGAVAGGLEMAVLATLVGPFAYGIPQIRAAARAADVRSLSAATLTLSAVECSMWTLYGVALTDVRTAAFSAIAAAFHLATLAVWSRRRPARPARAAA